MVDIFSCGTFLSHVVGESLLKCPNYNKTPLHQKIPVYAPGPSFWNFIKKDSLVQVFYCENSIFEIPIFPKTLNINNWRTASAKYFNLSIIRKSTQYLFKNVPFNLKSVSHLTLKDPFISESCIEIKIVLNFYFPTSLWCLKRFYEGL